MYLNFKKIDSAKKEPPMLRLQTLGGKELGVVPFSYGLKFEINYSDLSTIEFKVPYMAEGLLNPLYAALTGYKVVYTDELGVYIIASPEKDGTGISEIKTVKGYSLEYVFQRKNLYLSEGTYNFWNPIFPDETILGRIVELDPNWSVGYVAPRLIGCFRTFDEYDDSALNFCYGDAMEKYRCVIVFDVYNKTINAYDAGDDTGSLPIYLDYENLVQEIKVKENDDDMATLLHVYGGGDMSIRPVNPINGDYLVDLSYFLSSGDLDVVAQGSTEKLSDKVRRWSADVLAQQPYYVGLASLRSTTTARKLAAEAELTELKGELQTLTAQQSVYVKEHALEKTDAGKAAKQRQLDTIYAQIQAKNQQIISKQVQIQNIQAEIDQYTNKISSMASNLSIEGYFTKAERLLLIPYLHEGELSEETFVESDMDDSNTAALSTVTGKVAVTSSEISRVQLTAFSRTMYTLKGGSLAVPGANLSAKIVRGTIDVKNGNLFTLTAYLGEISYKGHNFSSGMITLTGTFFGMSNDITAVTNNNITQYLGKNLSFNTTGANSYFTVAANEFQNYSVAMELYDFGKDALSDYAWPVYEFDLSSANFLYHEKFEQFKNHLELGKSVHLRLGSEGLVHPKIIGVELDFEDITNFNLIFSNRYQRKDDLEYLKDEVHGAGRSSSRFDASKYLYDRTADKMTSVEQYRKDMFDAAKQTIIGAKNQSVLIDGAGINVSSPDDNIQLRIVNGMFAMTNDGWKTAKLAIGRFYSKEHKMDVWGVNADLIAGTLLLGSNLYIQTQGGYFAVDDTGAWLYNSRFVLQDGSTGGLIILDPKYGIVAGTKSLFNTFGTPVTSGFMDNAGNISYDSEGMPNGANFFLDIKSGDAYFRGTLYAKHGKIGGYEIEDGYLHSGNDWLGTYVALNGGTNQYPDYAIWAGYSDPTSSKCPFYVKKDGTIYAKNGKFAGTLEAADGKFTGTLEMANGTFTGELRAASGTFTGKLEAATGEFTGKLHAREGDIGGWTIADNRLYSGDGSTYVALNAATSSSSSGGHNYGWGGTWGWGQTSNSDDYAIWAGAKDPSSANFAVKRNGDVSIKGNLTLSNGAISWSDLDKAVQDNVSDAKEAANTANIAANGANQLLSEWSYVYNGETYINGSKLMTGTVQASKLRGGKVELLDLYERKVGTITIGDTTTGYGVSISTDLGGGMQLKSGGNIDISSHDGYGPGILLLRDNRYGAYTQVSGGNFQPGNSGRYSCGSSGHLWSAVYASSSSITISDRNRKHDIIDLPDKYVNLLMNLTPKAFKMNDGTSNRTHVGYIAQEVEDAMKEAGIGDLEFAGFVKDKDEDGNDMYMLRYEEFIAMNTLVIQKLYKRLEAAGI